MNKKEKTAKLLTMIAHRAVKIKSSTFKSREDRKRFENQILPKLAKGKSLNRLFNGEEDLSKFEEVKRLSKLAAYEVQMYFNSDYNSIEDFIDITENITNLLNFLRDYNPGNDNGNDLFNQNKPDPKNPINLIGRNKYEIYLTI